jgi:two-component system, chemotaxis family, sensor kinase Cph1
MMLMVSYAAGKAPLAAQIAEFFSDVFYTGNWPARWNCGKWTDFHGWLYIASEIMIWGAYFAIPILLFRIIAKRRDIPFPKVFFLFSLFILLCGSTHLMDAIIFWWPAYRFSAVLRFATGVVSVVTVFGLLRFFRWFLTCELQNIWKMK